MPDVVIEVRPNASSSHRHDGPDRRSQHQDIAEDLARRGMDGRSTTAYRAWLPAFEHDADRHDRPPRSAYGTVTGSAGTRPRRGPATRHPRAHDRTQHAVEAPAGTAVSPLR
jgi:hypothetical protein